MTSFFVVVLSFAMVFYFLFNFQNKINGLIITINDLNNTIRGLDDDLYHKIKNFDK